MSESPDAARCAMRDCAEPPRFCHAHYTIEATVADRLLATEAKLELAQRKVLHHEHLWTRMAHALSLPPDTPPSEQLFLVRTLMASFLNGP